MLEFSDVSAGYGDQTVLSGVDLALESGITVLLGPNGAGKTTLFRVGAGILQPASGTVTLDGRDPYESPDVKKQLRYTPHSPALYRDLTVEENLEFWARLLDIPRDDRPDEIRSLARRLEFEELLPLSGRELSRGQTQRVSLAISLLSDPSVLFLDEPSTGLDPNATSKLYRLLRELADEDHVVVYATHNLHEANMLAKDIILMNDGSVVGYGPKEEIKGLFDGEQTVYLRVDGTDVERTLSDLGYEATAAGEYWEILLPADAEITDLMLSVAESGLDIEEIQTDDGGLGHLYDHLEGDA